MPIKSLKVAGGSTQKTRSGKNYFDASKINNSNIEVLDNGKTIKMPLATSGNGYTTTQKKLSELCPGLKVGDVVYLIFDTNFATSNQYIYLNTIWHNYNYNQSSRTITQEDLDATVILYGNRYTEGETEQVILSNFRIVKNIDDDWEQYGASPSANFPSPIKSVGESWNKLDEIWQQGYYDKSTGNLIANNSFICNTNVVDVNNNEDYIIQLFEGAYVSSVIFYNNNTLLSYIENTNGLKSFTFKTPNNCNKIKFNAIKSGGLTPQTVGKAILSEGTEEKPYRPYGYNVLIEKSGKNKLKNSSFTENLDNWNVSNNSNSNPEIVTKASRNCLHVQGELQKAKNVFQEIQDRVEIEKTYTISCIAYLENYVAGTSNPYIGIYTEGRKSDNSFSDMQTLSGITSFTDVRNNYSNGFIKISAQLKVRDVIDLSKPLRIYVYTRDFTGDLYVYDLQLEEGTEATGYEEYFHDTYTIPMNKPLRSLPNAVHDTLEKDGIHRRVGSKIFDGSDDEGWALYPNAKANGYVYYTNVLTDCKKAMQTSLCSHFKNSDYAWDIGKIGDYSDHPSSVNKYFVTDKSTLSEWKQWLQENPIEVIYELAEPVTNELTEEQKEVINSITTEKGTTYFKNLDDSEMEIEYYKDLQLLFDKVVSE